MAKKRTHKRRNYGTKPVSEKTLDPLLQRCKDFLDANQSRCMDDSYDRERLAEEMVEFVALERQSATDEIYKIIDNVRSEMSV